MKKYILLVVLLGVSLAACGGSSTPAEPTSTDTKVLAGSAVDAGSEAALIGAGNGLFKLLPVTDVSASMNIGKAATSVSIEASDYCVDGDSSSGTYAVTGTMTGSCTGTTTITCNITSSTMNIVFTDCKRSITIGSQPYNEVLAGTASASVSGTIAGTMGGGFTNLNINGSLSGTPTLTGDVSGSANLAGISFLITGTDPELVTPECSGSCSITVTTPAPETTQTCSVSSDCGGCRE